MSDSKTELLNKNKWLSGTGVVIDCYMLALAACYLTEAHHPLMAVFLVLIAVRLILIYQTEKFRDALRATA